MHKEALKTHIGPHTLILNFKDTILRHWVREDKVIKINFREKCGYLNWTEVFEYRFNFVSVRLFIVHSFLCTL